MFKQVNYKGEIFQLVYNEEDNYILVASFEKRGYGFMDLYIDFIGDHVQVYSKIIEEGEVLNAMNSIILRKEFLRFIVEQFREYYPTRNLYKLVG